MVVLEEEMVFLVLQNRGGIRIGEKGLRSLREIVGVVRVSIFRYVGVITGSSITSRVC